MIIEPLNALNVLISRTQKKCVNKRLRTASVTLQDYRQNREIFSMWSDQQWQKPGSHIVPWHLDSQYWQQKNRAAKKHNSINLKKTKHTKDKKLSRFYSSYDNCPVNMVGL